jgi:polynucleotide 5'-kinase involved in rRNA processing
MLIEGLTCLKDRAVEDGADFLVINTDGWVEGEETAAYKAQLAEKVGATAVVGLQRTSELTPILDSLSGTKVLVIDSPQLIKPRSREKRRLLRELSYKKYLKGAKTQSFSLSWIKVECSIFGAGGQLSRKRLETLSNLLGTRLVYAEETVPAFFVVLHKSRPITEEQIKAAEDYFGKKVKIIREGEEEGLLVGLKGEADNFLGIGILVGVDYKRKTLKVCTPVTEKVSVLRCGQIKLDTNCKEIGLSTVFSSFLVQ